jgi:hypothetical protein
MQNIIFFSLHNHIIDLTVQESITGDSLMSHGVTPIMMIPHNCSCDSNEGFKRWRSEYNKRCKKCALNRTIFQNSLQNWEYRTLSDFGNKEDIDLAETELSKISIQDITLFQFRGFDIGKICLHDIILKYKIDNINLSQNTSIWNDYLDLIGKCILTIIWMERALPLINPVSLVVYNSNYSINNVIGEIAGKIKLPWYSIHGGPSLAHVWDTLMLTKGKIENYRDACVKNWENGFKHRTLKKKDVLLVLDHVDELLAGKKVHAYSSATGSTSALHFFSKPGEENIKRRILLALSSTDERLAVEESGVRIINNENPSLFSSQYDLLHFLIEKIKYDPEIELIIRVHPRDFPNKRENRTSSNGEKLKVLLDSLPQNIRVNWPSDNISFYDLLPHVDLVLTAWSTVLLEASLFGCPIVLPWNSTSYYDVIADSVCYSQEEYWEKITHYMNADWTLDRAIKSFRWLWFIQFGGTLSLKPQAGIIKALIRRSFCFIKLLRLLPKDSHLGIKALKKALSKSYNKLFSRPAQFIASDIIANTLLGKYDPMDDFRIIQKEDSANVTFQSDKSIKNERALVAQAVIKISEFITSNKRVQNKNCKLQSLVRKIRKNNETK